MSAADDHNEVLAAEFVLGTLDAGGRANVRMQMAIDPDLVASVARWERQLGELYVLVDPVEPSPHNWEWIKARIAGVSSTASIWMPSLTESSAAAPKPRKAAAAAIGTNLTAANTNTGTRTRAAANTAETDLTSALLELAKPSPVLASRTAEGRAKGSRGWRWAALLSCALALALVALMAARELRPELLPSALRPTPVVVEKPVEVIREVVREVPSQRFAEFVAVFQNGGTPSFLLSVDLARRAVSIRRLRAAPGPGRSYQVWVTTPDRPQPRSLGVLGGEPFTVLRLPEDYDAPAIAHATFGISLEQDGGAASGQPTGQLLKADLVQTIPAAFPTVAP